MPADLSGFGDVVTGAPVLADVFSGIDASLTGTGAATIQFGRLRRGLIKPQPQSLRGPARLVNLRNQVDANIQKPYPTLICIEEYSYGSKNGGERLGEWGGVLRVLLHELMVPFMEVPPSTLKKFITGNGNASKTEMSLALFERFGIREGEDNKADACGLALFALEWTRPGSLTLIKKQQEAIDKLRKEREKS